jgi:hypothetical protein
MQELWADVPDTTTTTRAIEVRRRLMSIAAVLVGRINDGGIQ